MEEKTIPSQKELKQQLPPISILFSQSWYIFEKSIVSLFVINFLEGIVCIGVLILGAILLNIALAPLSITSSPTILIISLVIAYIWITFIASMIQIADILVVDSTGQIFLGDIWRKSLKIVIPLTLIGLVTSILILGGYFLFILPGILFSFFFIFTAFEIVLEKQTSLKALKKSYAIVQNHFWPVIGRLSIIIVIAVVCIYGIDLVKLFLIKNSDVVLSLIQSILQILIGWFTIAYNITLYKQLKSLHPVTEEKSIRWISIVSAIGWIVGILLIGFLIFRVFNSYQSIMTSMDQVTISNPQANQTLCLGQPYNIQWKGPKLHGVSITMYYTGSSKRVMLMASNNPQDTFENNEAKGIFKWVVGQTNAGVEIPEGNNYQIFLQGFKPNGKEVIVASNYFTIADCSGNNYKPVPSTQAIEVASPSANEKLCLGQNYTIRWQGTPIYNPSVTLYTPQKKLVYGLPPIEETPPNQKQPQNTFTWKVGETNSGAILPESSGYYISINGKPSPDTAYSLSAGSNLFNIVDCSKTQNNTKLPLSHTR